MGSRADARLLNVIRQVAPGTRLRTGLDRIIQAGKGALIVVDDGPQVLDICSGGFLIDAPYSPQRLSELAKMDGAIILAADANRIARANVHLVPDHRALTAETGTRHRTAERVARTIDVPVISVSESLASIAVYVGDRKHPIELTQLIARRAEQALRTLERYRGSLTQASVQLSALEVRGQVHLRDVVAVLRYAELVTRIAEDIELDVVEMGQDGRLVHLQLTELMEGVDDDRWYTLRDYLRGLDEDEISERFDTLAGLAGADLFDDVAVATTVGVSAGGVDIDGLVVPQGYRLLSRLPRLLEPEVVDAVVEVFGELPKIIEASSAELAAVDGVGTARAASVVDELARLVEQVAMARRV